MSFQSGEQQQLSFQLQIGMQGALIESVQSPDLLKALLQPMTVKERPSGRYSG